jgi:pyridoxine kinase
MNILSIQSHVAYGHVGNAAAVFPLQRLGHEVWPINTVQFSNHTGYGAWKGQVFGRELIDACVEGIAERGALKNCDGLLSGYMGAAEIGEAILAAAARIRAANPKALYCCDPVIGDVGRGVFVRPGIPEFMRERAVPAADIVTPNQFELEFLTGIAATDIAAAKAAAAALRALGPKIVLVTSLETAETPADSLDALAADASGAWRVRSPKLPIAVNGAGDAIAALFFVHWLESRSAATALSRAVSSVYGLLKRTADAGSREILLVAAQDEFVAPSRAFAAEPV